MIRVLSILLILLTTATATASAQSLAAYRERLAQPAMDSVNYRMAVVTVVEQGDVAEAMARASRENARLRFKGYRVCIFSDNGQNARAGAEAAREQFTTGFPDTRSYIAYNSPYFTVTVGDCVTIEEAIILMGSVKSTFPKSFLKSEELSVADLIRP